MPLSFFAWSSEEKMAQPWVYKDIWNATPSYNKQQKHVWMLMFEMAGHKLFSVRVLLRYTIIRTKKILKKKI